MDKLKQTWIKIPDKILYDSIQDKVKDKLIKRILANIKPIVIVNDILYIDLSDDLKSDENKKAKFVTAFKANQAEVYRLIQGELKILGLKKVNEVNLDNLRFLYSLQRKFGGDLFVQDLK